MTLGKHPYMALLIGITLAVISSAAPGDMTTALWRGGDVVLGSILAILFTVIYPQKAYIQWRLALSDIFLETAKIYHAGFSANLIEKPRLTMPLQRVLTAVVKMRAMLEPASKETRIPRSVFEGIQTTNCNLVCTLELQINAWWASRQCHLILLDSRMIRRTQQMTENTLRALSAAVIEGSTEKIAKNSDELAEISHELRQLLHDVDSDESIETPAYGYVWLSIEMTRQLERLSDLIRLVLRN
ncbi:MAG: Inner membrane protein YeeA [Candidatus Erwinia impunctatus]|nr:Inner membrane protein YeeA [Culicoides impunctatus]